MIGRRLYVTDFGKEIALAAENILNQVYAINYKTMAHRGQLAGKLKISVVSTGKYVIPYFLSDFLKKHEGIELILDVTNKVKVIKSLEKNEVDFSLVSVLPEKLLIENVELMQNKLFLVSNREYEIKINVKHEKSILEKIPLIYREQGSGTRLTMERFIETNNLKVKKKMELTSNEAVKQAVIAGLGCSIMPLIGIKSELIHGELQIIPVNGFPIKSTWNLIWVKNKNFSPIASSFLAYIQKEKDEIIKEKFDWYEAY